MSSTDNNSNILRKDASDVFDQIRKKAENISTSEGSYHIFQNLSNPTNLTNPQIITLRRIDNYQNSENFNKSRLTKVKERNISQKYKQDKNSIQSNKTELSEHFLINQQIKRLIQRKKRSYYNKNSESQSQKLGNNTYGGHIESKLKKSKTMEIMGEGDKSFLEKLKGGNYNNNKKSQVIRVNKRKHITSREYITDTKKIQLLNYLKKNKLEKLNMLVNIRKSELDTLNKNLESLENNKESILTAYNKKYVTYINYLLRQKDNEEKKDIDLIIESGKIRKEISQIQSKINKVQKEKMKQLNLILLFIQIKENIRELPEMAIKLFGTSDDNLNKENKNSKDERNEIGKTINLNKQISTDKFKENITNNEDMKKIMQYKGKIIYHDFSEFKYYYDQIEKKIRKKIKVSETLKGEIKDLKNQIKLIKEEIQHDPNNEIKNHLIYILNDLIFKNEELKSRLNSLKIKFAISSNKNTFQSRNLLNNLKSIKMKSSSSINIFQPSTKIQTFNKEKNFLNTIFSNNSNTIYNPKTILSFKKLFMIENFDFKNASNLFLSCYSLYNIAKDNFFPENDIKFDIERTRSYSSEPEKATILKMLGYIENVLILLLKQKESYLENKHLRKKYEKIRDLVEENNRRIKLVNSLKKEEEKRKLKILQLIQKNERTRFLPTHKIENKYFLKTQKERVTEAINLAKLKRTPTFEDFVFDDF